MKKWMKVIGLVQIVLACSALSSTAATTVTNLVVTQRPGTKLVDITYDLLSTTTNSRTISLTVSNGVTSVTATNLTGAVGAGVLAGAGKTIVWNMGTDWSGNIATGVVFAVTDVSTPTGGDPEAASWNVINTRWVKNTYSNGDVTMSDRTTGRMWLYNANPCGTKTFSEAMSYCDNLTYAGYSDWLLPDKDTLLAQASQKAYFTGAQNYFYWSSTTALPLIWQVNLSDGNAYASVTDWGNAPDYVWPLRNGQIAPTGTVQSSTAIAGVDSRNYTLAVASAYGTPTPILGTNIYAWQSTVTCSVQSVVNNNGTNYTCTGWTGTGNIAASGSGNTIGGIMLTNLNSSITWNWQVSGDLDSDGMPDTWAYQYFGNATGVIASADSDNDGYANFQEYMFGTNPTDAQSRFEFSCRAPVTNNYAGLYLTTVAGRDYTVEYRTSLATGSWQPLFTMPGSGSPLNLKDYSIGSNRFYRVSVNMAE